MVDSLYLRVALQRYPVKPHGAELRKRGLEAGERLHRGLGFDEFVFFQNHQAQGVAHRHHRLLEVAGCACSGGAALGFERERVHIFAREAIECGNQVGANALWHEQRGRVRLRVLRPGAAVGANGHAAHALDAASHYQVFPARTHLLRRQVHGLQARGAEAVDLHARRGESPPRLDGRHLGQHRSLFTHGRDDAHDNVVHCGRVKTLARLQLSEQASQQRDGLDFVQAAVFFAFAARGAQGFEYIGFGHGAGSPVALIESV